MSKIAESSIEQDQKERVGANPDVGAIGVGAIGVGAKKSPTLKNPAALYRFDNVGAVFVISKSERSKIVSTFAQEDGQVVSVPITIPGGTWLLVNVGAIPGLEAPGFAKVDNPYPVLPPRDGG